MKLMTHLIHILHLNYFIFLYLILTTFIEIVVNQFYEAEILTEYVIRGNTAILKCSIPSFLGEIVRVEAWIDETNTVLTSSDNYGVNFN